MERNLWLFSLFSDLWFLISVWSLFVCFPIGSYIYLHFWSSASPTWLSILCSLSLFSVFCLLLDCFSIQHSTCNCFLSDFPSLCFESVFPYVYLFSLWFLNFSEKMVHWVRIHRHAWFDPTDIQNLHAWCTARFSLLNLHDLIRLTSRIRMHDARVIRSAAYSVVEYYVQL